MLYLAYLGESKKIDYPKDAMKFLIVRKPVSGIPKGFIHVPQLSPSLSLFEYNRSHWKQGNFTELDKGYLLSIHQSPTDVSSWWYLYERAFNQELQERVDMIRALHRLEQYLKEDKDIYLFCYCKDVCRCHRKLIGNYFQGKGYSVDFRDGVEERCHQKSSIEQLSLFDF